MSRDERIVPLIDVESGSSRRVRSALSAARDDVPSADHVEAMLARLPIGGPSGPDGTAGGDPGGGTTGAGGVGAGAGGAGLLKLGALAAITITAGAAYFGSRAHDRSPTVQAPTAVQSARPAPPPPSVLAPDPAAPSASPTSPPVKAAQSGSAQAPVVRTEIEILREAQAARGSNPTRALALVAEHARSHPNGVLAQEREMIRIEATLALGRRAEASALAQQFRSRYPGSAYAQRLDDVLGPP